MKKKILIAVMWLLENAIWHGLRAFAYLFVVVCAIQVGMQLGQGGATIGDDSWMQGLVVVLAVTLGFTLTFSIANGVTWLVSEVVQPHRDPVAVTDTGHVTVDK